MAKDVLILRIDPTVKSKLQTIADKDHRSLSNLVSMLLETFVSSEAHE